MKIKAGSRTSNLALWQAEHVADRIEATDPDLEVEIVGMETLGDRIKDKAVPEIGGKGLFTQRLEEGLLEEEIDLAVHSLKDVPSERPEGLAWIGSPPRANPADAFISHKWESIDELPEDATIATGSRRRRAQMRRRRPEANFENLRGNIGTRLEKLANRGWDGIVMASAALERLGRESERTERLDPTEFVPAVGQGAIGVEMKESRHELRSRLEPAWDEDTFAACSAERIFMSKLEGGCTVPLGGFCRREDGDWAFYGWVGSVSGGTVLDERSVGSDPAELASSMADEFIERGAREILNEV